MSVLVVLFLETESIVLHSRDGERVGHRKLSIVPFSCFWFLAADPDRLPGGSVGLNSTYHALKKNSILPFPFFLLVQF